MTIIENMLNMNIIRRMRVTIGLSTVYSHEFRQLHDGLAIRCPKAVNIDITHLSGISSTKSHRCMIY